TETPSQSVSSFDHLVTQWMSTVIFSLGSARNSSHVQRCSSSTSPVIVKSHWSSGGCGVGPADRTGKSFVTYWPGGSRPRGASSRRRPLKPREMIGGMGSPSVGDGETRAAGRALQPLVTGRLLGRLLRNPLERLRPEGGNQ